MTMEVVHDLVGTTTGQVSALIQVSARQADRPGVGKLPRNCQMDCSERLSQWNSFDNADSRY